ncbi:MAG: RHS repeat-associated core domain-containing protein [bacterium]
MKKLLILLFCFLLVNVVSAHKLTPTSGGRYLGGSLTPNSTVYFSGSTSHDNDSQNGGYSPLWMWDFDYKGGTPSFVSYNSSVTHVYTKPGNYTVAVQYRDDDGQYGYIYFFNITIMGTESYYYVKDHLGSIRQTLDEAGTIVAAQDYYAYGEIIPSRSYNAGTPDEKYKFTEKERDIETNYDYFGARYYNSKLGLWNSVDPLADKYPGISPYTYCANNPLVIVDTEGKDITMYYRPFYFFGGLDAGHIFIQVVDHVTQKVRATWSFGPKSISAEMILFSVEGHAMTDAEVNDYFKQHEGHIYKSTIETNQQIDKRAISIINAMTQDKEKYNLWNHNCGQTAKAILIGSGVIPMDAELRSPSSIFDWFEEQRIRLKKLKLQENKNTLIEGLIPESQKKTADPEGHIK